MTRLGKCVNRSPTDMWKKISAVMTDSVSKNLKICDGISAVLETTHVPLQLLCSAHSCERFDRDMLDYILQV